MWGFQMEWQLQLQAAESQCVRTSKGKLYCFVIMFLETVSFSVLSVLGAGKVTDEDEGKDTFGVTSILWGLIYYLDTFILLLLLLRLDYLSSLKETRILFPVKGN